ncbi:MAG TPA: AmmeMemoRadiSam system protein B [Nitrospinota bacterium]|nr:AmmeMemoRadiSam system protein B [Nitrospinota bacterium]
MIRKPAVAGQFYPHDGSEVRKQIKEFTVEDVKKEKVIAAVCPHAGYIYSGGVAGEVYSRIQLPKNIVIIGPNHTGIGAPASVMADGEWEMPTGNVKINSELANAIINQSRYLKNDSMGHVREHSLEVQLPFIQYFIEDFTIVPISLMRSDYEICEDVGNAIYKGIEAIDKETLIIASTDMTHYESHESAVEKDKKAIDEILKLNSEGLYTTIKENHISMCGFIPTTTTIIASKLLGAKECELIRYTTSGEVSGDYEHVVGYAGLLIK